MAKNCGGAYATEGVGVAQNIVSEQAFLSVGAEGLEPPTFAL